MFPLVFGLLGYARAESKVEETIQVDSHASSADEARVREWTHGSGVDHVIEVGGPGTLAQSITAVAIGGHIALIGVLTGRAGEIPTAHLMAWPKTLDQAGLDR